MVITIEKVGRFAIEDEKKVTLRVGSENEIVTKYVVKTYIVYYENESCEGHNIFVKRAIAFSKDDIENMVKAVKEELGNTIKNLEELITGLLTEGWEVRLEELEDHDY